LLGELTDKVEEIVRDGLAKRVVIGGAKRPADVAGTRFLAASSA
jgi:hypothetical protein